MATVKESRHLCIRCGRKRNITQMTGCECGKSHWCREGCQFTESKQWRKWNDPDLKSSKYLAMKRIDLEKRKDDFGRYSIDDWVWYANIKNKDPKNK